MAGKSVSACLLIGLALLCGLHNTQGVPSFEPPQLYPEGLKRAVDPASLESDEPVDSPPAAAAPDDTPTFPFIRMKPAFDPSQFVQMKADLLKNLFGPGGLKGPVTRAVGGGASKWAPAPAAQAAPASKWAAKSKSKAPAPAPAQPSPWSWPPPASAPASAPAPAPAPAQPNPWSWPPPASAPVQPAPAPTPGYWAPNPPAPATAPAPGYWVPANPPPVTDKKTVLLEALLDQYLAPNSAPAFAPASRFARTPPADPANPTPSPYLTNLLDSLNLTLPAPPPTLKPTIEPPGFWFPSVVPAPPGSLYPFVVDPTAMVAKKGKFLNDLFASKAAANAAALAALSAPTAAPGKPARAIDPEEYTTKVAAYLNSILDSAPNAKRAVPAPPKKSKTKTSTKAKPTNPPVVEAEATPEDEIGLEQLLAGLRKKRDVGDDADGSSDLEVAQKSAALLSDMAIIKQNILQQLEAMSTAESAASKAIKQATKAAKKASTIAGILNMPPPPPPTLPPSSLSDYQQKIATLTDLYTTLSTTQKNITSAPDANDPFNADKLFIAAVNAKMQKILKKNALLPTLAPPPRVARGTNWFQSRAEQAQHAPLCESVKRRPEKAQPQQLSTAEDWADMYAPPTPQHFKGVPNTWN